MKDLLNRQVEHWESTYSKEPTLYGKLPSFAAQRALQQFKANDIRDILELGCGHGRDTLFFALHGVRVHAIDYSKTAIDALKRTAQALGLSNSVISMCHDVRTSTSLSKQIYGRLLLSHVVLYGLNSGSARISFTRGETNSQS